MSRLKLEPATINNSGKLILDGSTQALCILLISSSAYATSSLEAQAKLFKLHVEAQEYDCETFHIRLLLLKPMNKNK